MLNREDLIAIHDRLFKNGTIQVDAMRAMHVEGNTIKIKITHCKLMTIKAYYVLHEGELVYFAAQARSVDQ